MKKLHYALRYYLLAVLVFGAFQAKAQLISYSGFDGAINSGTGWSSNWTDIGGWNDMATGITATGLTFGNLEVAGGSFGLSNTIERTFTPITLAEGESVYISYLMLENASMINFRVHSDAGNIWIENSHGGNNYGGFDNDWAGYYGATTALSNGVTTFNLLQITRSGSNYIAKRFVYNDPAKLPSTMPSVGSADAYASFSWDNGNSKYVTNIKSIQIFHPYGNSSRVDEIRVGRTFADVVPTATVADTEAPTTPTDLTESSSTGTTVHLAWTASTDNVGVTSYDVYVNGVFNKNVSAPEADITGLTINTAYTITVKAKDFAGNVSAAGSLSIITPAGIVYPSAYMGFDGSINSGSGWSTDWTDLSGYGLSSLNAEALSFGALRNGGGSMDLPGNAERSFNTHSIIEGDSICFSYLLKENANNLEFRIHSNAGDIKFSNAQVNNYYMSYDDRWAGFYASDAAVANHTTTFNLIVIKRSGVNYIAKRFLYSDPAKFPTTMPAVGTPDAFISYSWSGSSDFISNLKSIRINCPWANTSLIDEIRVGHTFADVAPRQISTSMVSNSISSKIYTLQDAIVADLSDVKGNSVITVIDAKGSVVKSVQANAEKATIKLVNKGIYMVRIQNGEKVSTQKVVLF